MFTQFVYAVWFAHPSLVGRYFFTLYTCFTLYCLISSGNVNGGGGRAGGLNKGGAFANFMRGEVKVVLNESRIILCRHSSPVE